MKTRFSIYSISVPPSAFREPRRVSAALAERARQHCIRCAARRGEALGQDGHLGIAVDRDLWAQRWQIWNFAMIRQEWALRGVPAAFPKMKSV